MILVYFVVMYPDNKGLHCVSSVAMTAPLEYLDLEANKWIFQFESITAIVFEILQLISIHCQ